MTIYEYQSDKLRRLESVGLAQEGVSERRGLQKLLKNDLEAIGEKLLVISEEFGGWVDSRRRIDLLCLDTSANLVVVELKITTDGGHAELQALRYAAMISEMTLDQAASALAAGAALDEESAKSEIRNFLNTDAILEENFGRKTRIILVSSDFDKEITTTVMWLNKIGLDIKCVRLKPVKLDSRILFDIQQIIPLPEAAEYQTKIGQKHQAVTRSLNEADDMRTRFWQGLIDYAKIRTGLHAGRKPPQTSWLATSIGRQNISLVYCVGPDECDVRLGFNYSQAESSKNKAAFRELLIDREAIENAFGGKLEWDEMPDRVQSRIRTMVDGGFRSPQAEWPAIFEKLTAAMIRFDQIFRSRVGRLTTQDQPS